MDDRVEVTLSSPAKVGLRTLMAGFQTVSAEELGHLKEAGVVMIVGTAAAESAVVADPDAAVVAMAEVIAEGMVDAAVEAAVSKLTTDKVKSEENAAALLSRIDEVGRLLTDERQKSTDLAEKLTAAAAELEALKATKSAAENTPVAKTTAKKGAATS